MRINITTSFKSLAVTSSSWLGILLFPLSTLAVNVQELTNPKSYGWWVYDQAGILSESTEEKINNMASELEAENGSEIVVVTVREISSSPTPKAFANELFNYWDIGKDYYNNGVLYLISVDDRRVEIKAGYGLTKSLPDARIQKIIEKKILPNYRKGNFERGTLAGTKAIIKAIEANGNNLFTLSTLYITLTFLVLFVGCVIFIIALKKRCPQCQKFFSIKIYRKIKQKPTETSSGIYSLKHQCCHCNYLKKVEEEVIPSFESVKNEFFNSK